MRLLLPNLSIALSFELIHRSSWMILYYVSLLSVRIVKNIKNESTKHWAAQNDTGQHWELENTKQSSEEHWEREGLENKKHWAAQSDRGQLVAYHCADQYSCSLVHVLNVLRSPISLCAARCFLFSSFSCSLHSPLSFITLCCSVFPVIFFMFSTFSITVLRVYCPLPLVFSSSCSQHSQLFSITLCC